YKDLVMNAIVAKGLRRHATGTAKAPPELIERDGEYYLPNRLAPLSDAELEKHESKVDEYLQKQAQVRQIIYETVSEATFMRIKWQPTAQRMLQQLVNIFEGKGEMVQMDTLTRLQNLRCSEDGDVVKHITEMQRLKEALDSMGHLLLMPSSLPTSRLRSRTNIAPSLPQSALPPDSLEDRSPATH
ncbi:hypothetical protein B0H10DRAFT_1811055, partial [Mycena sp. CBHHK59/15]